MDVYMPYESYPHYEDTEQQSCFNSIPQATQDSVLISFVEASRPGKASRCPREQATGLSYARL